MVHNNPDIDLVSDNEYKNLVQFCPCILKIWSKTQTLTSIMGNNSVVNLQKPLSDNVYTNFILNLSICCQDMEQKPNPDINQGL